MGASRRNWSEMSMRGREKDKNVPFIDVDIVLRTRGEVEKERGGGGSAHLEVPWQ